MFNNPLLTGKKWISESRRSPNKGRLPGIPQNGISQDLHSFRPCLLSILLLREVKPHNVFQSLMSHFSKLGVNLWIPRHNIIQYFEIFPGFFQDFTTQFGVVCSGFYFPENFPGFQLPFLNARDFIFLNLYVILPLYYFIHQKTELDRILKLETTSAITNSLIL